MCFYCSRFLLMMMLMLHDLCLNLKTYIDLYMLLFSWCAAVTVICCACAGQSKDVGDGAKVHAIDGNHERGRNI